MSLPQDVARAFSLIRQLQGALGGRSVVVGSGAVTWPGGQAVSTVKTVTHGLPGTPTSVQVTPIANAGDTLGIMAQVSNVGATSFDVTMAIDSFSPAAATARSFYWEAWG